MIPLPSLTGGRSREHSRLAKASVENIIKIQTCSASQNDRLNFSFVKDTHVVGEKMTRSGRKTDI